MTPISSSSAPLIVVDDPRRWPFRIPGVDIVAARTYLTDAEYGADRRATVYNLCRSYRYQSAGYYVSLLGTARGHRPRPDVRTIRDMKSQAILRVVSDELDTLIQRALGPLKSKEFVLSIYFARNTAKRYDALALRLSGVFEAPLLRATFVKKDRWHLQQLHPIAVSDVPESHRSEIIRFAREYFARGAPVKRLKSWRYEFAILVDPEEKEPPSNERALRRFTRAAQDLGLRTTRITKDDYSRISEFDALLIRTTTNVNHYTYRFAQRAAAEGLVVVDDPESIVRCTNKVFLAETAAARGVPTPETHIVHRDNVAQLAHAVEYPRVLKAPDSSASLGVEKVEDATAFRAAAARLLEQSDLVLAQEFLPTDYDWRIGVLGDEPLYACRYLMAEKHWQIINNAVRSPKGRYGRVETVPLESVPRKVLRCATRAARLMGKGLYGVDLKEVGRRCVVIEVNDNPSIDSGYEDSVLGHELYRRIMAWFLKRLEERGR